jgi:ABC-2 type transport system ATP-binding protein
MQEVQALCDRVIIINKGKLVANDSIEDLRKKVAGEIKITVEFQGSTKADSLRKIKNVREVKSLGDGRYLLTGSTETDTRPDIFRFAVDNNLVLTELHSEISSIEDIFQKLTKENNPVQV